MGIGMGVSFISLLAMILFWIGLIVLAVWLVKILFGIKANPNSPEGRQTALDILDQRYARGEITHEQYELMKQDLVSEQLKA